MSIYVGCFSGGYDETGFLWYDTVKLETTCSSEMPVYFQPTARRYIPEDITLHQ
jgi:hypothetical protein